MAVKTEHVGPFQPSRICAGGTLVCSGGDFAANFQGCAFAGCSLYAVHGAAATLRQCAFTNGLPAAVAHGPGTALHLHACTLENCPSDITVERGAIVTAAHCRSSGCVCSLIARDTGTAVSYQDCTFSGLNEGPGITAEGSLVRLRRCSVQGFVQGVVAAGRGAALELHGCDITASLHTVSSRDGAVVLLRQTHLLVRVRRGDVCPPLETCGAQACVACPVGDCSSDGGVVQLERCTLSAPGREQHAVAVHSSAATLLLCKVSCGGNGVTVNVSGGAAALSHCSVQSMRSVALSVEQPNCVIRVTGGQVEGWQCAAIAENEGRLIMRDAVAAGIQGAAAMSAIGVRLGATASLRRCAVRTARTGVVVVRAAVHATDVTVSGIVNAADYRGEEDLCSTGFRQFGGTLSVVRGSVTGCVVAACVSTELGDSTPPSAVYDGVTFDGNGIGICVCDGGDIAVKVMRCTLRGSGSAAAARRALAGFKPEQTAVLATGCNVALAVQDCTFRGHQRDFLVDSCSTDVSGCTFFGGVGEGPNFQITGSGTVWDCRFEGAPGGVVLRGGSEHMDHGGVDHAGMHGCTFQAGVATGVLICEGAKATISTCRFSGCKRAIFARRDVTVTVRDSDCTGADVGLDVYDATAVRAERLTFSGCEQAVTVESRRAQRATQPTVTTLVDCVATGSDRGAVVTLSSGVEVHMRGCTVEDSRVGLSVEPGSSMRAVATRMTGCRVAASVGFPESMLGERCRVCGMSGEAAVARAWRALRAAGPGGVQGAACAHAGAVAVLALQDVVMSDCAIGVQARGCGRVAARRLDVQGAAGAYILTRIGAAHVFEECTASGGAAPAVQCERVLGPEQRYKVEPEACVGIEVRGGPPVSRKVTLMLQDDRNGQ